MYSKSTMVVKQWLILLNIILLLLHPATCSSNITCSAGIATIGGPAKVTCYFNRNIKSTQTNFVIWKFPIDIVDLYDSTYRKDVLNCNWVKDKPVCVIADGYTFEGHTVGTTASVDIPSATADQEGIYKCQLTTQEIIKISTCNLTIQAREGDHVNQNNFSLISFLTPEGAYILIVGLLIISLSLFFVTTCLCHKYMCRNERTNERMCRRQVDHEDLVQTEVQTAERGNDCQRDLQPNRVDIGIDTKDLPDQQPAVTSSKGKSSGYVSRQEEKLRLLPKQHYRQSVERGINTSTQNCVSVGTEIRYVPDQQPVSSKRRFIRLFSRKKDKRSHLPLVRSHSADNIEDTHNEGNSSLSRQHGKSPGMQTRTATMHDEDQQDQRAMQFENQAQTPALKDSPTNTDQDTTYLAISDCHYSSSFDGGSYQNGVGSGGPDSSARMGANYESVSAATTEAPAKTTPTQPRTTTKM